MSPSPHHKALRLIFMLNVVCLLLASGMLWVSRQKAAATEANRAAYLPMDAKVRDLIESERDIDKLRSIARIENIGASGSMEALLHMAKQSTTPMIPGMVMSLASIVVAGAALGKKKPAV